jgi:hypothetical protein
VLRGALGGGPTSLERGGPLQVEYVWRDMRRA